MSGIVGILELGGAPVDVQLLTSLTKSLMFRGPHAHAIWTRQSVGLGGALFHTDEAAPARAPLGLDGQLWITADARLDGRDSLIADLAAHGEHPSSGAPDAELILRAYRRWQCDCVHHLTGDFTFVIWDDGRKQLIAARDPLGMKPLYYSHVGRTLVLSNTLDCIRLHPSVSGRLNELAVADFLLFGENEESDTTTFADIRRVPAGHLLVADLASGRVMERSYWTFSVPAPIRYRRESDYVEHFADILRLAVQDRLRGTRCTIFLSGGIDSSALAVGAKEVLADRGAPRGLRALTWVYDHLVPHEERRYAGLVAERLDIAVSFVPADGFVWLDRLGDPGFRTPEPFDDPDYALSVALYRNAAQHSPVVLYGEDGDALFRLPSLRSVLHAEPASRVARDILSYMRAERRRPPLGLGLMRRARARAVVPNGYPQWLDPELERRWSLRDRFSTVWSRWRESGRGSPASIPSSFRQPFYQSLWESLDPGFSGVNLDIRLPLMDLRLISFVLAIPAFRWYPRKRLLRAAVRDKLPRQVTERPKASVPGYWEARLRQLGLTERVRTMPVAAELAAFVREDAVPSLDANVPVEGDTSNLRPWILNRWLSYAATPGGSSLGTKEVVAC
jgi:asparagine synthase (glutamine-hydrolysing)